MNKRVNKQNSRLDAAPTLNCKEHKADRIEF